MPELAITDAQGVNTKCVLEQGLTWRMGRSEHSKIVLKDDAASRRHAIIQKTETGEYYLMDLGSRNGTLLNGRRLATPTVLNDGDQIVIGTYLIKFHNESNIHVESSLPSDDENTRTKAVFTEQLVTVLVFDIRGFTQMTQEVGQERLCKFIRRWFADASRILKSGGAWALKFIGDAVMAVWRHDAGAERSDVRKLLRAACSFSEISAASPAKYGLPAGFNFGSGANTGKASVGNAGAGDQTDFTAFGDAVNAAFRIEAATREIGCEIALGHDTAAILGNPGIIAQYFQSHEVHLKGYDGPTAVWAGSYVDLKNLLAATE
jgi:adenylate cyclase